MNYIWYKIFNKTEFNATGLVSKTYTLPLENIGEREILVTKGQGFGITYDGVFLSLGLNGLNPFPFDSHAIYEDGNQDVFLGVPVEN
jgi:hypothetical protein